MRRRFRFRGHCQVRTGPAVFGLLLAAAWMPAAVVEGQPRGDARAWVEERYETWGPFGEVRNWDGGRFHSEGRFYPVNAGSWSFWLDAAETGQELRFKADGIPSRAGRVSLVLGDYVVDSRETALRTEFQQPLWVRGLNTTLARGAVSFSLHAGTLTERKSVFGWGRTPLYDPAYGVAAFGAWRQHHIWKVDWNRQEAAPGFEAGVHQVSAVAGHVPPEGWSWLGQAKASREDETGALGGSAILGGGFQGGRFQGTGHLRRISPEFRGLGLYPDPHRNEWGGRLELSYRPRPMVLVGTSWDWARDLELRSGRSRPEERLISRFFAASSIAGPFLVRGSVGYRNRSTEDPDSLLVDQGAMSWEGAVGWNSTRIQAEAAYTRSLLRDPLSEQGDWNEDRVGFHGQYRIDDRWRAEFRGWRVNRRFLDGTWASRERKLEVRGNWEPRSLERAWLSVARDHQDASDAAYGRDQWELGAGWGRPLFWDLSVEVEGLLFARAGSFDTDRARVNFRVMRSFSFGGGGPGYRERLPEFGRISGSVYEDLNGDGMRQVGEYGLPGQVLTLSNGREIRTDDEGAYVVTDAATIYESVTLDVGRLPARFLAPEKPTWVYALRPGEDVLRDFPIRPAAGLAGRVMVDLGHRAEGVPDVLLRVRGTHHDVFTDAQGRYYIPGLTPGEVTVEVIDWSLPEDTEPQGAMTRTLRLRAGRPVYAGLFVIQPKGPKVIQIFRPENPSPGSDR